MKYYINVNNSNENDEYGWIYIGLKQNELTVTVFEEITGCGSDVKYMNYGGYELPLEDLKEIKKDDYYKIKNQLENNGNIDEIDLLLESIIKN